MQTTLALDDDLLALAKQVAGLLEKSALVRETPKALIQRESVQRLARLGGTESRLATTYNPLARGGPPDTRRTHLDARPAAAGCACAWSWRGRLRIEQLVFVNRFRGARAWCFWTGKYRSNSLEPGKEWS